MKYEQEIRIGILLDDSVELTLKEICHTCHVSADVVLELVEAGILEPRNSEHGEWWFTGHAIERIERALNLQQDLDINLAGVALVLDLLDEIDHLRERVQILEVE